MTYSKTNLKPIQVTLVFGLLGSGKTSLIQHLLSQKLVTERWALLINDFGVLGIDASTLKQNDTPLLEVQGGCICCSAQRPLAQTLQTISQDPSIERLIIEPSGLAHPAQIIDTLKKTITPRPLELTSSICLLDTQRFSPEIYKKSALLRDFIQLADLLVLTRSDQISTDLLNSTHQFLQSSVLGSPHIHIAPFGQIDLNELTLKASRPPFLFLQATGLSQQPGLVEDFKSNLPKIIKSQVMRGSTQAVSWIWHSDLLFQRPQLKVFFAKPPAGLIRAKGLLRTGNEWQLINWVNGGLAFHDQAWRQDSRLELLFDQPVNLSSLEQQLTPIIHY
ncbi:GTP-binding protein [Thiomicrospira sp. R3]|uniref:CobW family GTP-binding protein n=1 Tax=Thiomicrospira sp. R3 TaxID=3035472 RepID=UPI00259BADD4|nr:GTP-binding protein [Thiomicrospira sp. R3]WFE69037.1 GTP-binding protein [Thiomicrospira sp. R3]